MQKLRRLGITLVYVILSIGLFISAACGTAQTGPRQPFKQLSQLKLTDSTTTTAGNDVYVAAEPSPIISGDSWHITAQVKLPGRMTCPKDGSHRGLSGWVGLYSGDLKNGHFYQTVVSSIDCEQWSFLLSDLRSSIAAVVTKHHSFITLTQSPQHCQVEVLSA